MPWQRGARPLVECQGISRASRSPGQGARPPIVNVGRVRPSSLVDEYERAAATVCLVRPGLGIAKDQVGDGLAERRFEPQALAAVVELGRRIAPERCRGCWVAQREGGRVGVRAVELLERALQIDPNSVAFLRISSPFILGII